MYIKEIQIQNYGPLDNINLNLESDTSSNPILPLIFVGKNGSGKTLLLSFIVDSLIEIKRHKYSVLQEVEKDQYFKLGKKDYIKYSQYYSYINIEFKWQDKTGYSTELTTNLSHDLFTLKYSSIHFQNFDINDNTFKEYGFYKKTSQINEIGNILQKNVFLYFPPSRYEKPAWLGEGAKVDFQFSEKVLGISDRNIIKNNVLKEVEAWILNLILDRELYEKRYHEILTNTGFPVNVFMGFFSGKNSAILDLINQLLTIVYKVKYKNIEYARIGVSEKNRRNISILIKNENEEVTVSPSFSHLSSGEIMLFSLFSSILKEYDDINATPIYDTSEISGIVLIDEIDLHLHIEFQKEILPLLLKFFPKIQFIITTHSPFFILGLDEIYNNQIRLIDLPLGNEINITDFSEFQKGYDVFLQKNEQFKLAYNAINLELSNLKKPRIITEGKTDWKHLKKALLRLQSEGKFKQLDIEFLEYEAEVQMGDGELFKMCDQFSKTPHERKVIFVFDRDSPDFIKKASGNNEKIIKDWGNNVFSFCIPIPSHREKYTNISIEFYYKDNDIKTKDELGKRLYFSNEIDIIVRKSATNKTTTEEISVLNIPKPDEEFDKKIYDNNVDKIKDENGNLVALSKSNFADKIYNDKDGFAKLNISEFDKIFDIFQEILQLES